jgi:DNA mismatch repair protein MutS
MKDKETPLMRQYNQLKRKAPDTVLLFRLGDFFETFGDDAVITAKVCGITLTKRNNGSAGDMPLAGFPHHQLDQYLPKIVRAGYRVAVCEQLEDPKLARGIVRRDIVEVVTPGIALYDKMLDARKNTYVAGVILRETKQGTKVGFSFADASTGEFFTCELSEDQLRPTLEAIQPTEVLLLKQQVESLRWITDKLPFKPALTRIEEWIAEEQFARELLLRHFKTQSLKGFGVETMDVGISSAGLVLHYISEMQLGKVSQFRTLRAYNTNEYMVLDGATKRNLELTYSISGDDQTPTLITTLDKTCTAMGSRLLKRWMLQPLCKQEAIEERLGAVRTLVQNHEERLGIRSILDGISDIERLIQKVCTLRANTREIISLKNSLKALPLLQSAVQRVPDIQQTALGRLTNSLVSLNEITDLIERAMQDEPSIQFGTGGIFKTGYNDELDAMREAMYSGKNWITSYQEKLREESAIPSLKVGFNNVFGYYIEISNSHRHKVPESFTRKQTMTNAERYITPELKDIESKILNAEESIGTLEQRLFADVRSAIAEFANEIQFNAQCVAKLDCLQSFAQCSYEYNYTEPIITNDGALIISAGRHPVVERLMPVGEQFVPNNTTLNLEDEQVHIITGPNMAGKSCYLRQVGLITYLAHIGSFVPAQQARISITDRIFTRVGAQDNITAGESTFLVEMQEAANILNNATSSSLILLDEVGRGTATFDGISIAWALGEYIHEHIGAKTLFATHYHELNDLAELYPRIKNYHVAVREVGTSVIFTRKVEEGSTDHSFGIHVAQMAGLPSSVIARAGQILRQLEANNDATFLQGTIQESDSDNSVTESSELSTQVSTNGTPRSQRANLHGIQPKQSESLQDQLSMFELRDDALREKLRTIDINNCTPIQALQVLSELKNMM